MKIYITAGAALLLTTSLAAAGGLDRSGQSLLSIFNDDGTADVSFGYIMPSVTGTDGNNVQYDVGASYVQLGATYTREINSEFSFGLIYDQPFGADIFYNGDGGTLSGTKAAIASDAFSAIGKYQLNERVSVFGGLRMQRVGGGITLNGTAYQNALATAGVAAQAALAIPGLTSEILGGALQADPTAFAAFNNIYLAANSPAGFDLTSLGGMVQGISNDISVNDGYQLQLDDDLGFGYSFGAAYEIPEIAFRAAITYHSEVDHNNSTSEDFRGTNIGIVFDEDWFFTPQSVNVEFQTGIAENTLLNASMRWTNWGDFDVISPELGTDLANLDDSYRWSLGVARRFSEEFAGSLTMTYEEKGDASTVSPLGPNDGQIGISLGGRYESDGMTVSGGVNYTMLGDADAGVGGQAVASFTDNTALAVGLKVAYSF